MFLDHLVNSFDDLSAAEELEMSLTTLNVEKLSENKKKDEKKLDFIPVSSRQLIYLHSSLLDNPGGGRIFIRVAVVNINAV